MGERTGIRRSPRWPRPARCSAPPATSVRDISVNGTHLRQAIDTGIIDGPGAMPRRTCS